MTADTQSPGTDSVPRPYPFAGTPFHLLARSTPRYRWWRLLLGSLAIGVAMFIARALPLSVVAAVRGGQDGDLPVLGPLTGVVASLIGIVLSLPAALAVTRWIGACSPGTLISVAGRLRWRWLGTCTLIAASVVVLTYIAAIILTAATGAATERPTTAAAHPPLSDAVVPGPVIAAATLSLFLAVVVLALTVVQSATEEVIARGWILQTIGGFTGSAWLAIIGQAAIFAALHGFHGTVWGYASLTAYAVVVGWLTTGGIEAGIAFHACWNSVVALLTVALWAAGRLTNPDSTMADTPWHLMLVQTVGFIAYALLIRVLHRRRRTSATPPQT